MYICLNVHIEKYFGLPVAAVYVSYCSVVGVCVHLVISIYLFRKSTLVEIILVIVINVAAIPLPPRFLFFLKNMLLDVYEYYLLVKIK